MDSIGLAAQCILFSDDVRLPCGYGERPFTSANEAWTEVPNYFSNSITDVTWSSRPLYQYWADFLEQQTGLGNETLASVVTMRWPLAFSDTEVFNILPAWWQSFSNYLPNACWSTNYTIEDAAPSLFSLYLDDRSWWMRYSLWYVDAAPQLDCGPRLIRDESNLFREPATRSAPTKIPREVVPLLQMKHSCRFIGVMRT